MHHACRLWRTRSESVWITMPSSAGRLHDGMSVRLPSSSTTHTRHTLTGVRFSAQQSVGVSTPAALQASSTVWPEATCTSLPSMVSDTATSVVGSVIVIVVLRSGRA